MYAFSFFLTRCLFISYSVCVCRWLDLYSGMSEASRCTVSPEGHSGNARSAQLTQNVDIVCMGTVSCILKPASTLQGEFAYTSWTFTCMFSVLHQKDPVFVLLLELCLKVSACWCLSMYKPDESGVVLHVQQNTEWSQKQEAAVCLRPWGGVNNCWNATGFQLHYIPPDSLVSVMSHLIMLIHSAVSQGFFLHHSDSIWELVCQKDWTKGRTVLYIAPWLQCHRKQSK